MIKCIKGKSTSKIIERIKMELSAVFFDVDGTIAETEEFIENHLMNHLRSLV